MKKKDVLLESLKLKTRHSLYRKRGIIHNVQHRGKNVELKAVSVYNCFLFINVHL